METMDLIPMDLIPTDLIPITHVKMAKDKWLQQKIKYEDELVMEDILNEMSQKSYNWIMSKQDLEVVSDYASFKEGFINLCYDKYLQ